MRINDMVRASFQKEQVNKPSNGLPTAEDPNYVNPFSDPLRRVSDANKRIIPVSNNVKEKFAEIIREDFTKRGGMTNENEDSVALINSYLETLPREDRSAASWTLNQFRLDISHKYVDEIRKHNPSWKVGDFVDPKILEGFDPMKQHLDISV